MKKIAVISLLIILLGGCAIRIADVPPRVYSLESAMQIVRGKYNLQHLEIVSGYENVELKGMVAIYKDSKGQMYLLYGFKSLDDSPRTAWKSIVKKYGIWNLGTYLDFPSSGYYSVNKKGKYIVAWWKDVWLFVVESNESPKEFVKDLMNSFASLGGMLR